MDQLNPYLKYLTPQQASQWMEAQRAPKPAPAANNQSAMANIQQRIKYYQRLAAQAQLAGESSLAAQYNAAAIDLQNPAKGYYLGDNGVQALPGFAEQLAQTEGAKSAATAAAKRPYDREQAQFESDLRRGEADRRAETERVAKIGEVGRTMSEKWESNPAFKNMANAQTYRNNAENDYKAGTTIGDLNLVLAFYKTVDPGSTVTGNEADTAARQKALTDKVNAWYEAAANGALPQKARDEIMSTIHGNYQSVYENQYKPALTQIRRYAHLQNVENVNDAIRDPYNIDATDGSSKIYRTFKSAEQVAAEQQAAAIQKTMQPSANAPAAPTLAQPQTPPPVVPEAPQAPVQPPAVPMAGPPRGLLAGGAQQWDGGVPVGAGPAPAADGGIPNVSGPNDPAFLALPSGAKFNWNGKIGTKQ